ncbi:MAG TPA: transporter substrate-binding protein, partial [Allocoleopsis sp.]
QAGLTPDQYPVMSTSITEEEVQAIGSEFLKGQYAVWNYFMTIDNSVNQAYVEAFRAQYGESRVTTDPMESAYIAVHLWKQAVEKVRSEGTPQNLEQVRAAVIGQTFDAPEGPIKMYPNHHISKFVRIGQVQEDGLFQIVYDSASAVPPSPWNQFVPETKGFVCDWTKTNVENPGKFKP